MLESNNTKFCQSCIERSINPPMIATREWQANVFYCDECFDAVLQNMIDFAPAGITKKEEIKKNTNLDTGPVLDYIYNLYSIPIELQFDRIEKVQSNRDKIFNFHAPAIINRDLESLATEIEQLGMVLFHVKYRMEPLEMQVNKLKEERRKAKGLESYNDSKEEYAKGPAKKTTGKVAGETKVAKALNTSPDAIAAMLAQGAIIEKKKRERQFNILADNCAECGGKMEVRVNEGGKEIPYCLEHIPVEVKK